MFNLFKKKNVTLHALAKGQCMPIEQVPDEVFSTKMMGDGVAFRYDGDTVYSPCDGKIIMVAQTNHAVGIQASNQVEILIHAGLNSVELNGEGLTVLKKVNDKVRQGEPLIKMDRDIMKEKGIDMTTPMIITDAKGYKINIHKKEKVTLQDEVISFEN